MTTTIGEHPQAAEIDERLAKGESPSALAREFGFSSQQMHDRKRAVKKRKGPAGARKPKPITSGNYDEPMPSKALTPQITFEKDGTEAVAISCVFEAGDTPDEARLIRFWELNPDEWEIVDGTLVPNKWMVTAVIDGAMVSSWNKQYKARLKKRVAVEDVADLIDIDKLSRRLRRKLPKVIHGERYLVVVLADWQVGKGEGGGTPAWAERMRSLAARMRDRLREAKRLGRPYAGVAFFGMGDLVEQCSGHYAMQAFGADLDRRSQINVATDVVIVLVDVALDEGVEHVLIAAVPGNHGENRNSAGKAFTTWTDNDDLLVFDGVERAFRLAGERYAGVTFQMPSEVDTPTDPADPLVLVVEVSGIQVGLTHGHVKKGGGHAAPKMETWWQKQCMGNRPIARAQILISGHLHHFICSESTGRTFFQSPALDGGSYWFTASSGQSSPPGVLMFDVGTECGPRGWNHPEIAPCLPLGD